MLKLIENTTQFLSGAVSDLTAKKRRRVAFLILILLPITLWIFETQTQLLRFWHIQRKVEVLKDLSSLEKIAPSRDGELAKLFDAVLIEVADARYLTLREQVDEVRRATVAMVYTTSFWKAISGGVVGLLFVGLALIERGRGADDWSSTFIGGLFYGLVGGLAGFFIPLFKSQWINFVGFPILQFTLLFGIGLWMQVRQKRKMSSLDDPAAADESTSVAAPEEGAPPAEVRPPSEAPFPRLYTDLAMWWPLLSAPAEYSEEAAFFQEILLPEQASSKPTLLELGSGGGNNASHLKASFEMTLIDRSPGMLQVSHALNPECEHIESDMRTVRLGRQFDRVFIHDAIVYMITEDDLRRAIETSYVHCKPGGIALFVPDHTRESFQASTSHGGHDGDNSALRYLEWTWDPDPTDCMYLTDYAYLLRGGDGSLHMEIDRHIEGLFAREDWLRLLTEAGFQPEIVPFEHSELEPGRHEVFVARRPE